MHLNYAKYILQHKFTNEFKFYHKTYIKQKNKHKVVLHLEKDVIELEIV